LGDGNSGTTSVNPNPTAPSGLGLVSQLSSMYDHTCAVLTPSGVACWGLNTYGQLGANDKLAHWTVVAVTGLGGVTARSVSAGQSHSCAVIADGGVDCWGGNQYGQLGGGFGPDSPAAVHVQGLSGPVADVSAGAFHTCAALVSGAVVCWGDNALGEVGSNGPPGGSSATPVVVPVTGGARAVAAGNHASCALLSTGRVQCWGSNENGLLGSGLAPSLADGGGLGQSLAPLDVVGLGEVEQLSGYLHFCARVDGGSVFCWGHGTSGELGDGNASDSFSPVRVQ
jgi:alpha-tubulin suppressor-like RCC1 family protein